MLFIWQDVLINLTSLVSQCKVQKWILGLQLYFVEHSTKFLQDYKTNGFTKAKQSAEKIALQLNVEPSFKTTRTRRK